MAKEELNESKDKDQLVKEELESVAGGRISPTWLPVDEICKEINQGTTCASPGMKGHCGNCRDCKHNN